MVSISADYDLIDSFLNRRRQAEYTDKLLDQLLHESSSVKRFSSSTNLNGIRNSLTETDTTSDISEKVLYRHVSESEQNVTSEPDEPLSNLYLIKVLKDFFNIRSGSFTELVVNVSDKEYLTIVCHVFNECHFNRVSSTSFGSSFGLSHIQLHEHWSVKLG